MLGSIRIHERRRGSVYVAVLGAAMIIAVIALTILSVGQLTFRNVVDLNARGQARASAQAGVEFALNWLNKNGDWRTQLTSGWMSEEITTGKLRFRWGVEYVENSRFATLHVIGRHVTNHTEAYSAIEVVSEPAERSFNSALHSSGASITKGEESSFEITGGETNDELDEYYRRHATIIPLASLSGANPYQLSSITLSRSLNPYGASNPLGIYLIDCQGADVELDSCQIFGTLVLRDAGSGTKISGATSLQPETPDYPSLMVVGDLGIATTSDSNLDGGIYVTGAVRINDPTVLRGPLVAGLLDIKPNASLTLECPPGYSSPLGFTTGGGARLVPGSWVETRATP